MKKLTIILGVVLVGMVAMYFLWTPTKTTTAPVINTEVPPVVPLVVTPPTSQALPATSVKEFTVTGKNFAFSPSSISVSKGDSVKITFENNEGFHDFVIDELNVATKKINGGQKEVLEFVADKTGSFEFYCSVGPHRALGMKGMLIVK